MRLTRLVAAGVTAALAGGCSDLTELGPCAEPTRELWPVHEGARWTYRITPIHLDTPLLEPEVEEKEQEIDAEDVEVGGLIGNERGSRMRVTDPIQGEWDHSWHVERDGHFRWMRKLFYRLDGQRPEYDRYFSPPRTRLDYSAERLCLGSRWHEQWEETEIEIEPEGVSDPNLCPYETWRDHPADCLPSSVQSEQSGSTWTVVAVGATVSLFGGQRFYENNLCLHRIDDDGGNDSLYCWSPGIGKTFECEQLRGQVVQVEELCRHCGTTGPCTNWSDERPPLCTEGYWTEATCDAAFLR